MKPIPQYELPGAEQAFNLAGEQTGDGERMAREAELLRKIAQQNADFQSKHQQQIDYEKTTQNGSRL